ncbi:hypothetical protein [Nocardia sp. NPDC058497]|uniref:hypothetical protein n=1 Tax=Nocardia sp. NPDC058497 TaxID=3346529 RepID=UPI00365A9AEE
MWGRTKAGKRALTVDAIQARIAREAGQAAIAQDDEQTGRTALIVHSAPAKRFSIDQARQIIQAHRGCDRTICPRKMAAINVLVGAGLMRLDRRVGY